ncbi:MAG TPA: amidohydrolase, partial [Paracoccus sp. (in: a-proteobacteria)]|nr:amidohydrolase [Paracoccus sp. (in: a-proteobacteria)]
SVDETARAVSAAISSAGTANVDGEAAPLGASEDFAYMLERVPGAYINIGIGEKAPFVHTPRYDFNDAIIPDGVAYWINIVGEELAHA